MFDTQDPITSTLLTQIELGKLNNEKQIKKQLETTPSIKDLKIAKQLKRLRDFNQKRMDDDDDNNNQDNGFGPLPPLPLPPPFDLPPYNPP